MDTVPEIASRARAHLNDMTDQIYHTDVLLPFINDAYEEIQAELNLRGIKSLREVVADIPILANTNSTISRIQIPDLFYPISLQENPTGSNEDPTDMTEFDWDSQNEIGDKILYWTWREGEIKIPQVTQNTSVIVKYRRMYLELDNDDAVLFIGIKRFLAARTAALAAGPIGGNFELASYWDGKADIAKDVYLSNAVKELGKFRTRRKPFRRAHVTSR